MGIAIFYVKAHQANHIAKIWQVHMAAASIALHQPTQALENYCNLDMHTEKCKFHWDLAQRSSW